MFTGISLTRIHLCAFLAWQVALAALVGCSSSAAGSAAASGTDLVQDSASIDLIFGRAPDAAGKADGAADAFAGAGDSAVATPGADGDGVDLGADVTQACYGAAGCPCKENAECDTNLCIATPVGMQCAKNCFDVCPAGFKCSAVTAAGGDISTVCLPRWGALCNPCMVSSDCATLGVSGAACTDQGAAGHFCGAGCTSDADCPASYICNSVATVEAKNVKQCQPAAGECTCSPAAMAAQLSTECSAPSKDASGAVLGTCKGVRGCGPAGLSACNATPMAEACNGADDNCNGQIDEGSCEDNNVCTLDICDTKSCSHTATPGACNADSNACTAGDSCQDGVCKPGAFKTCDDGNPCTLDVCDPQKGCTQSNDDGLGCSDGDGCTTGDVCVGGACKGSVKECSAGSPCATAACDASTGSCVTSAKADSVACEDGSACTVSDACKGGSCTGVLVACDDGIGCTLDTCDAKQGCQHSASTLPCDDGNACTQGDVCKDSACAGQAIDVALACDDGQVCTSEVCDTTLGCTHIANLAACNDGNACTVGDACEDKVCMPGANTCQCSKDADCGAFDDSNLCNGTLFCDKSSLPFACKTNPATVVTCGSDADTACTTSQCDGATGKCGAVAAPDAKPCDADGDPCTVGDACKSGLCTAGTALVCDDGNSCSDEACQGGTCVFSAKAGPCNADDNACTQNDACEAKNCVAGAAKICDDGVLCTADSCTAATGTCAYDKAGANGKACSDGSVCTVSDACQGGICTPGAALPCSDANDCTLDLCSPLTGCKHDANTGPCDADGNPCTEGDYCSAASCIAGTVKVCNDGELCTVDSCSPLSGLCHFDGAGADGKGCEDGSVCSVADGCLDGGCKPGTPLSCDDKNDCTNDTCDAAKGCQHTHNSAACDADGNACTQNDTCADGGCVAGSLKVCNDSNICTDDACAPASGTCPFPPVAIGFPCDKDGNVCTDKDSCQAGGICMAGPAKNCDDSEFCTTDSCDPTLGCQHVALADDVTCAASQVCKAGKCAAPVPVEPTKAGDLILTEIMADPEANTDGVGEWFEVYNPGTAPILIDQLEFQGDKDAYLISQPGLVILPGQYFIFGNSSYANGYKPDFVYDYMQFKLTNGPDRIDLYYKGVFIDGYEWTSVKSGYSLQFSPPAFIKGCTISTNKFYCDSSGCDIGTPGAANDVICP